jgi:hypothetical protein
LAHHDQAASENGDRKQLAQHSPCLYRNLGR